MKLLNLFLTMVYQKVFMKEYMPIAMVHFEIILKVKPLFIYMPEQKKKIKSPVVQVQSNLVMELRTLILNHALMKLQKKQLLI